MKQLFSFLSLAFFLASCTAQQELTKPLVKSLAGTAVRDSKILPHEIPFIIDEANIHTLQAYQALEKNGYIRLTLLDSSRNSQTYQLDLLPKAKPFVLDSIYEEGDHQPIVQTIRYDSLRIISVSKEQEGYAIQYEVVHPHPTPFHIEYYRDSSKVNQSYESVCYVRLYQNSWQIDHRAHFNGYEKDEFPVLLYVANPKEQDIRFFNLDDAGKPYENMGNLREQLYAQDQLLLFGMNAGMFTKELSPQGLYVEDGKLMKEIDRKESGYGNFYLQPNGVFYLTESGHAHVTQTPDFERADSVLYATQSGPMLLIDGKIHPKLTKGSSNLNIRNGVGILPDGNILFAISYEKINFYDFATYFKEQGCKNALYLDGFVSRAYIPYLGWAQLDGPLGLFIGIVRQKNE